jgi:hypothetical protein
MKNDYGMSLSLRAIIGLLSLIFFVNATSGATTVSATVGRGAQVPRVEYQAEDGMLGGGASG